ncbi:MAG: NIPSNAP family protein [Armatimonadetes bacterium]|nr:NIPSNAP family protein [Armatimonadota bacterium]
MIYEYRAYYAMPGKRKNVLDRFANHTMALFERHGIRAIGFWESEVGDNTELIYICQYDDLNHRSAAWADFRADPEWQEVVRRTEADGPIVARVINKILTPASFSPLQ